MKLKLMMLFIAFSFLGVGTTNASSTVPPFAIQLDNNGDAEVVETRDASGNTVYTFLIRKRWTQSQFNQLVTRGFFTTAGLVNITYNDTYHQISATFSPAGAGNRPVVVSLFNKLGFDDFMII